MNKRIKILEKENEEQKKQLKNLKWKLRTFESSKIVDSDPEDSVDPKDLNPESPKVDWTEIYGFVGKAKWFFYWDNHNIYEDKLP